MAVPIQSFANGDTNYVAKLNANFSALGAVADALTQQIGVLTSGTGLQTAMPASVFGPSTAFIGNDSYQATTDLSVLTISTGFVWLPAAQSVVQLLTEYNLDFTGFAPNTYYLHIGTDGNIAYDTTALGAAISVVWDGASFGEIVRLIPTVQIEYFSNKDQPNGYPGLSPLGKLDPLVIPDLSTTYQAVSEKGAANGYAELDAGGLVPTSQLPSFGTGSVTSVGLSAPAEFSVTGSPVTGSGTLAIDWVDLAPGLVLASPATDPAGPPVFRALQDTDLGVLPYDVGSFYPGVPGADALVNFHVFNRPVTFPDGLTGSHGVSLVAATAATDFVIQKNGSNIGTMSFALGATTATFSMTGAQSFSVGDRLQVIAPHTPDATLANITHTLAGER